MRIDSKKVCFLLFLSFSFHVYGQNNDFVFRNYVPGYQKFKKLNVGGSANAGSYILGLSLDLGVSTFKNTEKHQTETSYSGNIGLQFRSTSLSLSASYLDKYYFTKSNPLFLQYGGKIGINSYEFNRYYYYYDNSRKYYLSAGINLGFGYGRMNVMDDAVVAQNVFNKLVKVGLLTSDFIYKDDFISLITKLKNDRQFRNLDFCPSEIEKIIAFFQEKGVDLKNTDAVNVITKEFKTEPIGNRLDGNRITISFAKDQNRRLGNEDLSPYVQKIGLSYEFSKVINPKWQLNIAAGLERISTNPSMYQADSYNLNHTYGSIDVSYFPNVKTKITLGLGMHQISGEFRERGIIFGNTSSMFMSSYLNVERRLSRNISTFIEARINLSSGCRDYIYYDVNDLVNPQYIKVGIKL